ncbi:MAG: hypothetical protein J0L60_04250 [Ignavibacteria bacterium]|nr:hypothetical protein [Ignavibacteria bacterium]
MDKNEKVFQEYFAQLEDAEKVKELLGNINREEISLEYMKLLESYKKLLKSVVKLAKLGDRAQARLIKYKEMIDKIKD